MFDLSTALPLAASVAVAYFVGAVPVAAQISRLRGVDIFSAGTGLAGAANVFRTVGHLEGALVFAGDALKGAFVIAAAQQLGVRGDLILIPALFVLMGHWRSVFTRFRGGDGLSPLVGMTVALMPVYGFLATFTGAAVGAIAKRTGHRTAAPLWGGSAGYGFLLVRAPATEVGAIVVLGMTLLAALVLVHAVRGHRRRAPSV